MSGCDAAVRPVRRMPDVVTDASCEPPRGEAFARASQLLASSHVGDCDISDPEASEASHGGSHVSGESTRGTQLVAAE